MGSNGEIRKDGKGSYSLWDGDLWPGGNAWMWCSRLMYMSFLRERRAISKTKAKRAVRLQLS